MVEGARFFCSRKNRQRTTTVRLKAKRGSEQYHPMNSSMAMTVGFLRTGRCERVENCVLRLLQVGQPKYCFGPTAFQWVPTWHTGGLLCRSQYGRSVGADVREAGLNGAALRRTLSRAGCQQQCCRRDEAIRWGHKEMTYDPPSQNDARGTRAS